VKTFSKILLGLTLAATSLAQTILQIGTVSSGQVTPAPPAGGAATFSSITNTGLTAGRVVYSTTAGLETDSAAFTFSAGTLTLGTNVSAPQLTSTIAIGTAPFVVTSTTQVANLNAATAGTVTTNANLTGPITSVGNATSVAAQTGTGSTFAMQASPTIITPTISTITAAAGQNFTASAVGGASLALNSAGGFTLATASNQQGTINTGAGSLVITGSFPAAQMSGGSGASMNLQSGNDTGVVSLGLCRDTAGVRANGFFITNDTSSGTVNDLVLARRVSNMDTTVLRIANATGAATFAGTIKHGGLAFVTAQYDATTNTTLANVPGLSVTVVAGGTYKFRVTLHLTPDTVGGQKVRMAGTATATTIIYEVVSINNTTNATIISSRITDLGTTSASAASGTSDYTTLEGYIVVANGGTLTCQFAQTASNGTSSVLVGSLMEVFGG
jgi:hypothetical protein